MHTNQDALAHITEAIEATGVIEEAAAEYDLDGIADELYTAAGDTWNIEDLDTGVFWWVVQRHARDEEPDEPAPEAPEGPSPATDEVASSLAQAAEQVANARESLKAAEADRDQLLARTHRTGAYTKADLARITRLTRARVTQILS